MGQVQRREDGQRDGLSLDLELRACTVCRRELLPWQEVCPDDGGAAILKRDLPPDEDARLRRLAERLLAEEPDDVGAEG